MYTRSPCIAPTARSPVKNKTLLVTLESLCVFHSRFEDHRNLFKPCKCVKIKDVCVWPTSTLTLNSSKCLDSRRILKSGVTNTASGGDAFVLHCIIELRPMPQAPEVASFSRFIGLSFCFRIHTPQRRKFSRMQQP